MFNLSVGSGLSEEKKVLSRSGAFWKNKALTTNVPIKLVQDISITLFV